MVVLIRNPELYARAEIYLEEIITAEEVERIKGLTPFECLARSLTVKADARQSRTRHAV
jgi:hypothetical protein